MNRLERLINLVAALLDAERPLSREELHQRVPGYADDSAAFRRAFERDKETLRTMGIPIQVEAVDPANPEDGSGYRIPKEEYYLRDPDLAPDELAALHLAATTVRLEGSTGTEAIWKLGGAVSSEDDGLPAVAALPGSEHLAVLFSAVAERRTVSFAYRDEDRQVDPYRLAFRNGRWYLAGFDRGRGAERSFRLDRMTTPPVPGDPGAFDRPAGVAGPPPPPWEMGDEEPVTAELLVDADQAHWALTEVGDRAEVERREDGSVILRLRVTNRAAFRTFVLDFLDHAEVLAPEELRADVVEWLEAMVA